MNWEALVSRPSFLAGITLLLLGFLAGSAESVVANPAAGTAVILGAALVLLAARRVHHGAPSVVIPPSVGFAVTITVATVPLCIGAFVADGARPYAAAAWVPVLLSALIASRSEQIARWGQALSYAAAAALVVCVLASGTSLTEGINAIGQGSVVGLIIAAFLAVLGRVIALGRSAVTQQR